MFFLLIMVMDEGILSYCYCMFCVNKLIKGFLIVLLENKIN